MKSMFQKAVVISVATAAIGFLLMYLMQDKVAMSNAEVFALGLFIGGMVLSMFSQPAAKEEPTKTLYVGNLPYRANEVAVRKLFEQYGAVLSVRLMKDKNTGKRRGFGFVEMHEANADKAVSGLNDKEYDQRVLKVREAKQKGEEDLPVDSVEQN